MHIFGSVQPQTESTFPFLYIIIFQRYESFEPPSSTLGGHRPICSQTSLKFNAAQLLFQTVFNAMRIFGSVELQTEFTFLFLYIIVFQRWESFKPPSSTLGGR